jgi:chromosome segregation ATPase
MDDTLNLEEPPPIQRYVAPVEKRRKSGLFTAWSGRPSTPSQGKEVRPTARSSSFGGGAGLFVVACVIVVIMQAWFLRGLGKVRNDVAELNASLKETRNSLGVVWQATKRLDEDRTDRLSSLADSLRSVLDRAEGEARLWEASYSTFGQRLTHNDKAVQSVTNGMRAVYTRLEGQRSRIDALERSDRMHTTAVEALARRTEGPSREASVTPASLRQTLGRLDSDLALLEQRMATSTSAYGQLGKRVESIAGWADGFRRAGLNADAVQGQFAALADEVRRVRLRVDSLRFSRSVLSSSSR